MYAATDLGETLAQTRLATALFGDQTRFTGPERSVIYRWFTDPASRLVYPEADHGHHGRVFVSQLRAAVVRGGTNARAAMILQRLRVASPEFLGLWNEHEVGVRHDDEKDIVHPELGVIRVQCQVLLAPDQAQAMLIFTATPGTESYEKLQLLGVIGTQKMTV